MGPIKEPVKMQRMYPRIVYGELTICLYLEGRSVLVKKPVKANCCCSPCTCPSDIWLLFLPVSQGVFIDHSLITLPSPLFAHLGFFQLLWLESNCFDWTFWRKLRDWQSQPSRKHHLLSFSLQNPHRWKSHVFSKFQHLRQKNFGGEKWEEVLC